MTTKTGWLVAAALVVPGFLGVLHGCGGETPADVPASGGGAAIETTTVGDNVTLKFVPEGVQPHTNAEALTTSSAVSVFFPKAGQRADGICWQGMVSDAAGNFYPVSNAGISKLDRSANILYGKDDTNYFAREPQSEWAALAPDVSRLFSASLDTIRSAPFRAGSRFTKLTTGLPNAGTGITVGRGPLAGSLFVSDGGASRVYRVVLQPLSLKPFASGPLFSTPEAIVSAPDGTLYVVNVGSTTDPMGKSLLKITTAGKVSVFAKTQDTRARRLLAVDAQGTVYWSSTKGIERFKPDGTKLAALPGPPDAPAFQNPMGAAFDPAGNLYVVENEGCKKIYKYRR